MRWRSSDDADEQDDADHRDDVEIPPEEKKGEDAPPRGGQGGEDGDGMNEAFVRTPRTMYTVMRAARIRMAAGQ